MTEDDDDKVVSFPLEDRLKQVESDRSKSKSFFDSYFTSMGHYDPDITVSFSFDNIDLSPITLDSVIGPANCNKQSTINYSNLAARDDRDRMVKFMEHCHQLQVRGLHHFSNNNDTVFNHIEALLEQLIRISNIND